MAKKKILQDSEGQLWPITRADCVYTTSGNKNIETFITEQLATKANSSHGTHLHGYCTTITDWNNATTNGWYMGNNAANAPTNTSEGGTLWYFGEVIAHNSNYVLQTVYLFTASTDAKAVPKYIRMRTSGTWGSWTNVTVAKAVPSDAKFTDTNTWRGIQNNLTSDSANDSLSAAQGKALKSLIDGKANSSHTHNYAGSGSAGGAATSANILNINNTETKNSGRLQYFQKSNDSTIMPDTGWWSLIRTQHNGYDNGYWQEMAYAFGSDTVKFRRNVNGTKSAWKTVAWTDSNITGNAATATKLAAARTISLTGMIKGSVSFDGSGNASISTSIGSSPEKGSYFKGIVNIGPDGVCEIGKYIDFHNTNTTTTDYSTRLQCNGDTANTIDLPTSSGTLALTSQLNNYLPLSGGQMNGPIKFVANATSTDTSTPTQLAYGMLGAYGTLKVLGNTDKADRADDEYVHIAAACGLNPESWDGIKVHGTYATSFGGFIDASHESWIDLTGYSESYWYPVYCKNGIPKNKAMSRIKCTIQLDSGSKPSWSTHQQGFTAILDLLAIGGGWGTADAHTLVLNHQARWTDGSNPVGYINLNNASVPCFYLRGGGTYRLIVDYKNSGWNIVTSQTTINDETIKPETYNPGVNIWRTDLQANMYGQVTLPHNHSLLGRNSSGNNYDLIGVDENNQMYIGWGSQTHINVHNGITFKNGATVNTGYGNFLISSYGNPFRLEFVPESNGDWDWGNKCYMDNAGQFYASKKLNVAGHRITPYSDNGVSIIRPDGQEFSGLEVKELWIGPYSGATYKFVVSPSAPSASWGTVWVQI